jgi:transposase
VPAKRPKLDPFIGIIDQILEDDTSRPAKQRHTSKRIFERARDEHGCAGGLAIVKDYVLARRQRLREVFVPLRHDPGHAQADFGEAVAVVGGVEQIHFFALDLPHSDAGFVQAYPTETTEAFCVGHAATFSFFGKVPKSILYDNTTLAVARILGDGTRQWTRVFSELQSHYLFLDRFGRPGKGNDKGKVEGLVGYVRRNFLVPVPRATSFDALNADCLPAPKNLTVSNNSGATTGLEGQGPETASAWIAGHLQCPAYLQIQSRISDVRSQAAATPDRCSLA